MSDLSARRHIPWPAVAFMVILLELLLWNLYSWRRNQKSFVAEDRPRIMPRGIGQVAAKNNYDTVTYTFNMYYRLRALRGKVLVLPEIMKGHVFQLERVSRLKKVEIRPDTPPLPIRIVDQIYSRCLHMKIDVSSLLEVYVVPAEERYIFTRSEAGDRYLILPESMMPPQ